MGLNNFILNCEKENQELKKDIKYYKNKRKRLQNKLEQQSNAIDECIELIAKYIQECTYGEVPKYQKLLEKLQQAKGDNNNGK